MDAPAPPLVYISYSHTDSEWLNKLLVWLQPLEDAGQIALFHDRNLKAGDVWEEAMHANLARSALGILLLSPESLASEYIVRRELPAMASLPVIPVLIRECDWRSHPEIARYQILMADGKPLSAVRAPKQDQAFRTLVESLRSQLHLPSEPITNEVRKLFDLADRFAGSRMGPRVLDGECLVYAFIDRGSLNPTNVGSPQFLWNALPSSGRAEYANRRKERFPIYPGPLPPPNWEPKPDGPIFQNAAEFAASILDGGSVHARHLLAATLNDPEAQRVLAEFGLDLPHFRKSYLEFIVGTLPDEPAAAWSSFLQVADPALAPDPPSPTDTGAIASYQSEDWNGADLLNITRDVNALAGLVAGWSVQPPLSIGLFGEWGSGKSYFMRQMRARVKRLALAAQASGRPQRECAYYKNIAQIEFNAWHYMEGDNLWACLVEHIFSNLGLPQDTTRAEVENRQKQILEKIGAKKILEEQTALLRKSLETRKDEAVKKAAGARTELDAKQIALNREKAALWPRIKSQLSHSVVEALKTIPASAQLEDSADAIRKLTGDARTLAGRIRLLWNLFRHDPQRLQMLAWLFIGSAILWAIVQVVPALTRNLQPALQYLAPFAAALAATAAKFRPVLAKIGNVVSTLEKKNQEITDAIATAEKAQQIQVAKLESDVKSLTGDIDKAVKEETQHQVEITKLEKELAETDAGRLLSEFIKSRADADDYRKHLGMVALVRRDFERLSGFFREHRTSEQGGTERLDNNTVNRIVLYIDDLDRCPPKTVVDVLQAVHLLLAFPIFVVVVAVDSRWVSRSLERCYDWLIPEEAPTPRPAGHAAERSVSGTGATAHDYLEKIFQIPFWLAPMTGKACQDMIRGLTQAVTREQATLQESIARAKQQAAVPPPVEAPGGTPATSTPPPQAGAPPAPSIPPLQPPPATPPVTPTPRETETIDLAPRHLDVVPAEIEKIDQLAVLIGRSPRVAKRFLNCYRLLKSRMDEAELKQFLDVRFRDVMEVLAIVVGAPSISREVMDALNTHPPGKNGEAFLDALAGHLPAGALATSDGIEVGKLLSPASPEHLAALRAVVPLVSRFSFSAQYESAGSALKPKRGKSTAAVG